MLSGLNVCPVDTTYETDRHLSWLQAVLTTYCADTDSEAREIRAWTVNDCALFIAIATLLQRLPGANKNASLIMREAVRG